MSGLISVSVEEARGFVATSADLDRLAVVMGCSSLGSGLSSFFLSGSSAIAARGYGDAVDTLTQIIEQRQSSGSAKKFPAAMYTVPGDTAGSYGTIDISDVTGTCLPEVNSALAPYGTYELKIRMVDGCTVGVTGGTYQRSQDNGRSWSNTFALGTATEIAIPNSNSGFVLGPPSAQVTALIAMAVEARADTLAHLADVVAHDGADTSAAQVALAASSVPTTAAQAWAVMNLCRAALASHETNITVHNGPDPVNVVAHAVATNVPSGVDLAAEYRTDFNAHLGIALGADADGLKVATATVTDVVVLTDADLLAAGLALMATYPRRITFTTAGATEASAPASVDIVGTDYAGAVQTETLNLAQTATSVTSVKAYKTITSLTYAAADDIDATVAIGYAEGVHNSADVTNTISAAAPTNGTLAAGDEWTVRTFAPAPSTSDVDAAFTALASGPADFAIVVLDFPCDAAMAAHVTTGLDALATAGKDVTAIVRTRLPDFEASESDATWNAAVAADFVNFDDSRIHPRATYGLITDAVTTRQYRRSDLAQFAADAVRVGRFAWPCAPADRATPNMSLVDADGATVGHDEGVRGASTGLSNETLGNRFGCQQRLADPTRREDVFNTAPWVLYAADERIRNLMTRRLANAMKRVAKAAGIPKLGSKVFYVSTGAGTGTLTPASRNSIQGSIYQALKSEFASEIDNADDAAIDSGLVQVASAVTVTGGNLLGVSVTLAPRVGGFVLSIDFTLSIQE